MPMMHPEDEANSDAPLVPDVRRRNRIQTAPHDRTDRIRREIEPLRRELATIRSRIDDIETRLTEETRPR